MKLHLLGINGPFPESGGATSGYLLRSGDTAVQLDLGAGTLAPLTALYPPAAMLPSGRTPPKTAPPGLRPGESPPALWAAGRF